LEIHQILHEDAPMGSDFVEGQFVGFQELDQMRAGNPEQIGGRHGLSWISATGAYGRA
jgi:hypothetical protein